MMLDIMQDKKVFSYALLVVNLLHGKYDLKLLVTVYWLVPTREKFDLFEK